MYSTVISFNLVQRFIQIVDLLQEKFLNKEKTLKTEI